MAKLTLNNVANGGPTGVTAINANSDLIEAAIENTLSRDGTSPNQMNADLDMNNNDILNANSISADALYIDGVVVAPSTLTTLAANSVGASQIIDGSVGTVELADESVTFDKLADDAFYIVPPTLYGATLSGTSPDRELVKQAWQYAVANDKPFIIPIFDDGEPLEIQVPEDFATVQNAHDTLLNWVFPGQIPKLADTSPIPLNSYPQFAVRISMSGASEQVYDEKGLVWMHPYGDKIELFGRDATGLSLASFQASTFNSGVHLTRIRFSTWPSTAPRVGAAMRILSPTGTGTDVDQLDGIWRITAVDSVNQDITLAVFSHEMVTDLAITALSGGIYVYIPAGIRGTNQPPNGAQNGIIDVHTVLHANDFYISGVDGGTNDPETNNIVLRYGARLDCAGYGGAFEGTRTCLWALAGSVAQLDNWAFCGSENFGISAIQATIDGQNCSASGNLVSNVVIQFGATASLVVGNFGGAGGVGIDVTGGGKVICSGTINKCDIGIRTRADGRVDAINASIQNSTTTPIQRLGEGGKVYMDSFSTITGTAQPPVNFGDTVGGGITTSNKSSATSMITGTTTWNPASIANGAQEALTVAVSGATIGMKIEFYINVDRQGLDLFAYIPSAGNVTFVLSNNSGIARDLGLFTLTYKISSFS